METEINRNKIIHKYIAHELKTRECGSNGEFEMFCGASVKSKGLRDYQFIEIIASRLGLGDSYGNPSKNVFEIGRIHTNDAGQFAVQTFLSVECLDYITCPDCKKKYKDYLITMEYYCPVHGFLQGKEVTFEEKCDYTVVYPFVMVI